MFVELCAHLRCWNDIRVFRLPRKFKHIVLLFDVLNPAFRLRHERVTAKSASHLSMLSWELFQDMASASGQTVAGLFLHRIPLIYNSKASACHVDFCFCLPAVVCLYYICV